MGEVVFEVREAIISPCDHPSCKRWATVEIRPLGGSTWEFQRVCRYHRAWAKRDLIQAAGRDEGGA